MLTIQYILDHPDEFNPTDSVIVVGSIKESKTTPKKRIVQRRKNPLTQFEIRVFHFGNKIDVAHYELLKKITRLSKEGENISYNIDNMWFVTRSQKTLDMVNKTFGSDFDFKGNMVFEMK